MKRFFAVLISVIILGAGFTGVYFLSLPALPDNMIYNYLEKVDGTILFNMDDYLAVSENGKRIIIYRKDTLESFVLADSAFDAEKDTMFMLSTKDNTVYYASVEYRGSGLSYYSFDLDTYDKVKLLAENSVRTTAGFLGVEKILGISLSSINVMNMINAGASWINGTGAHNNKSTVEMLSGYDKNDKYGVYDELDKIAENDKSIYFINYFGELVVFDKEQESFRYVVDGIVSDFFITENKLYYISAENSGTLYCCDLDGKNQKEIGNISPDSVRIYRDKIYLSTEKNSVYFISDDKIVSAGSLPYDAWSADENYIYSYNASKKDLIKTIIK